MSEQQERTETICPYCGVGCGLALTEGDEEGDVRLARWNDAPVNGGALCIKGGAATQVVNHEDRLTEPLIREDGELREATWDEALSVVADELGRIREDHGPDATGFFASSQVTNEESYLVQKLARQYGTNNVDNCTRLCHASTVAALGESLGMGAMTNSMQDLRESADVYWIQGANPAENHVIAHSNYFRKAAEDGTFVVQVDPHENETTDDADLHLRLKPGTDIPLLNAVLATILEEGWHDEEFVAERTEHFESLRARLEGFDRERAAEIAGVSLADIERAAEAYATADGAAIFTGMGMSQHTCGTDNVQNLINLALATGNLGRPGTGVNPLRGQNNVQGTCDVGALPNVLPGYLSVDDEEARERVEDVWGFEVPDEPGLTNVEITHGAGEEIRGLYVVGENPVMSEPNSSKTEECLGELDFLAVQDVFLTETAELADVVLPATSWAERGGTVTNTDRRVQRMRAATRVPGNTRHDFEILTEVGRRLFESGWEFDDPEDVFEELREVCPIYRGISYDRLGTEGLQWPCYDEDDEGEPYLYAESFETENGLGKFRAVSHQPPAEVEDEEYPFVLSTGRIEQHYNSGAMSTRSETLMRVVPENFVEIHPEDAEPLGIEDGQRVVVSSRRGEVELTADVTDGVKPGVIWSTPHFPDAPINKLTNDALDPEAKIPEYKAAAGRMEVALRPAEGSAGSAD
ncbi:formate dehydrogenase subunit alpha [Halorussus salilacus]|uniref:formate dehydrogenase subunit alpha n=1 Tax=Halorussus salilacus TaxID=2953750 RepID=UPI0020A119EB|nr:formate dehydrogenase subunit alpha [Halorussus salilacus]USZ69482.1 formate dehydrogenase subunit alpha [Halorussus salilacus]